MNTVTHSCYFIAALIFLSMQPDFDPLAPLYFLDAHTQELDVDNFVGQVS